MQRPPERRASAPADPRAELAEIVARADELVPAIADRLAPMLAKTSDARVVRLFLSSEIRRLLSALAAGASEPARRALLGLEFEPLDARSNRDKGPV